MVILFSERPVFINIMQSQRNRSSRISFFSNLLFSNTSSMAFRATSLSCHSFAAPFSLITYLRSFNFILMLSILLGLLILIVSGTSALSVSSPSFSYSQMGLTQSNFYDRPLVALDSFRFFSTSTFLSFVRIAFLCLSSRSKSSSSETQPLSFCTSNNIFPDAFLTSQFGC